MPLVARLEQGEDQSTDFVFGEDVGRLGVAFVGCGTAFVVVFVGDCHARRRVVVASGVWGDDVAAQRPTRLRATGRHRGSVEALEQEVQAILGAHDGNPTNVISQGTEVPVGPSIDEGRVGILVETDAVCLKREWVENGDGGVSMAETVGEDFIGVHPEDPVPRQRSRQGAV